MNSKLFVLCIILPALCLANPFPQPTLPACPTDDEGFTDTLSSGGTGSSSIIGGEKTAMGGGYGNINTDGVKLDSEGGGISNIDNEGNKMVQGGGKGDLKTEKEKLSGGGGGTSGLMANGDKYALGGGDTSIKEKNGGGKSPASNTSNGQTSLTIEFGKATSCQSFGNIEVIKATDVYIQKITSTEWYTVGITQVSVDIKVDEVPACWIRYATENTCSCMKVKFENQNGIIVSTSWGQTSNQELVCVKETFETQEEGFGVYKASYNEVLYLASGSQEIVPAKSTESLYGFQCESFGIIATDDLQSFGIMLEVCGENQKVYIIIAVEEWYVADKREELLVKVRKEFERLQISEGEFTFFTETFTINTDDYQTGSGGKSSPTPSSNRSLDSPPSSSSPTESTGCPPDKNTPPKSPSPPSPQEGNNTPSKPCPPGSSPKSSSTPPSPKSNNNSGGVSISCEFGQPTIDLFAEFEIIKSTEEYTKRICSITWFTVGITQISTTDIVIDEVPGCWYRYGTPEKCACLKVAFEVRNNVLITKSWGETVNTELCYIQEELNSLEEGFGLYKTSYQHVMYVASGSKEVVKAKNSDSINGFQCASYGMVATDDLQTFGILLEVCEDGQKIYIILATEEWYAIEKREELMVKVKVHFERLQIQESDFIYFEKTFTLNTQDYSSPSPSASQPPCPPNQQSPSSSPKSPPQSSEPPCPSQKPSPSSPQESPCPPPKTPCSPGEVNATQQAGGRNNAKISGDGSKVHAEQMSGGVNNLEVKQTPGGGTETDLSNIGGASQSVDC